MFTLIAAQAASTPQSVPVTLQADVSFWLILGAALLNPALIAAALYLGREVARKGEGFDKLLVAGFIAAVAGVALIWVAAWLRLPLAPTIGRAAAGLFALSILTGAFWAFVARQMFRR
ncbi:MAG: hypothetical protein RL291_1546 [Pseudomonadota bacterium]